MSDTFQTGRLNRLRFTPLRDVLRGRLTGRLNVRARIASANLPTLVGQMIWRIVKRTRLWRMEKVDVADELIAHFADGLASGATADDLIRDFGDERAAAKLIRRAKKRNRPLAWHAMKYVVRGALVVIALLGIQYVRFIVRKPTVSVDYVAKLNTPIEALAADARAWPMYREALLSLKLGKDEVWQQPLADDPYSNSHSRTLGEALPTDAEWPTLVAWLDEHAHEIDLIRKAADKPALGFKIGPNGDANDPAMHATERDPKSAAWKPSVTPATSQQPFEASMMSLLLPDLNHYRVLANLLATDLRVAIERRESDRILKDLLALRGIARQVRESRILVSQLVGIGIDSMLLDKLSALLLDHPELLDDAALTTLAHTLVGIGGETASTVIDFSGERAVQADMIQRVYTDDGDGDGYLTPDGMRALMMFGRAAGVSSGNPGDGTDALLMIVGSVTSPVKTRRAVTDEVDRLMTMLENRMSRPRWQIEQENPRAPDPVEARLVEIVDSWPGLLRLMPVRALVAPLGGVQTTAERLLYTRDGVLTGIALELHRRRHGSYPTTLAEISRELLPCVPVDPITGDPMRYRVVDGKPVIYSVGVDRDDDAGRVPLKSDGTPDRWSVFRWRQPSAPIDGDWIAYGRVEK